LKVLVTGGAGFIGSGVCEKLVGEGYEVCALDDLSTGRKENIAGLAGKKGFDFVEGDVCNKELVDGLVKGSVFVYHLAASVGVQLIVDEPVRTIETNIGGTEAVLAAGAKYGSKVLIASTSEVYGKSEDVPFREDDDSVLGSTRYSRWSYACSKAIDEFLAFAYHRKFGLDVVIARIFNTIGPRQVGSYGMVVPRFVRRCLGGESVSIYGNGRQSRCFAYVDDVVNGLVGLMESERTGGEVYNIGSDEEVTIEELADKVIGSTKSEAGKKYISYEEAYGQCVDDMQRRMPCLDKIRECIGYEVEVSLDEAIERIINYYRERNK
jgi:UDP-glucose 4-epimerase